MVESYGCPGGEYDRAYTPKSNTVLQTNVSFTSVQKQNKTQKLPLTFPSTSLQAKFFKQLVES